MRLPSRRNCVRDLKRVGDLGEQSPHEIASI
jgi:hypothetical protein